MAEQMNIELINRYLPAANCSNPVRALMSYFERFTGYTLEFENETEEVNAVPLHTVKVMVNKILIGGVQHTSRRYAKEMACKHALILMQDNDKLMKLMKDAKANSS